MTPVAISAAQHGSKAWRRPADFAFVASDAVTPLVGIEFAKAAVTMPIAFIQQAGQYVPVAIMSPVPGRNLFVGPAGQWLGGYVPAALRGYPFCLGRTESSDQFALCIDEDSGLIVDPDGTAEAFFDADGKPAPATKAILDFLLEIERHRAGTEIAVSALADGGVIQPWPLQVAHDGKPTPVSGFFRIDEAALNALDDAAFLKLRRAGALKLAYLELLSTNQIAVFERLSVMQQQLAQAHQQQRQISSLDELFANASSDTLRFN